MNVFLDAVGDTVLKLFDEDGRKKRPALRMTQKSRNRGQGGSGTDRQRSSSRGRVKTRRNRTDNDTESSTSATVSGNTSVTETLLTRTTANSFAGKTVGTSVAQSTVGSVEGLWLKHQRSTSVTRTDSHLGGSAGHHALFPTAGNAAALRRQSRGSGNSSRGGSSSDKSDPRRPIHNNNESTRYRSGGRSESPRRPSESRSDKPSLPERREIYEKSADYTTTHQATSSNGRREVAPPRKEFRSYTTQQPNNHNLAPLSTSAVPPYRNRQVQWPSSGESSQNLTVLPKPQVPIPRQKSWAANAAPPHTADTAVRPAYGHDPSPRSTNLASTYGPQMMVDSGTEQHMAPPARSTSRTHSGGGVRAGNSSLQPYGHGHPVQNTRQVLMVNRQLSRLSEAEVETDRDDSSIRDDHEDQVNVLLARALAAEEKSQLYLQELQELRIAVKEWEQHGADELFNQAQRRQVLLPAHQVARAHPVIPRDDTVQNDLEFEPEYQSRCIPSCGNPLPNWLKRFGCLARPNISQPATRPYRTGPPNENSSRTSYDDLYLPNGTPRNEYAQAMMMHPDHLMMPQLDPTHASRMRPEDIYEAAARSNDFGGLVHEHPHAGQHKLPELRYPNTSPRSKTGSGTGSKSSRSEQYYGEHRSMLMPASAAPHQHVRAGTSHQYHHSQQQQPQQQHRQAPPPPPPPGPLPHNLEGRTIVIYPGPTPDQMETGTTASSSIHDHSNPYYVM
jgi:hypothetical protein